MPPVIKALLRSEEDYVRTDAQHFQRVKVESRRSFQRETEFERATEAAKLQRLFSKPLVKQFSGHGDSVESVFCSDTTLASSGADGFVKLWDVQSGAELYSCRPHTFAMGAIILLNRVISGGLDGCVVCHDMNLGEVGRLNVAGRIREISASWGSYFAVCADETAVFDVVKMAEVCKLGSACASAFSAQNSHIFSIVDGISVSLYDMRMQGSALEFRTNQRSNALAFNPQFPSVLTLAADDGCAYSFDLKQTSRAIDRFGGESFPLLDVRYSPNGRDFACANNQGAIMLFKERALEQGQEVHDTIGAAINQPIYIDREEGRNNFIKYRDLYHSKRMTQVNSLAFSEDGRYVFSGSQEGAIRQWRCYADQSDHTINSRQLENMQANKKLVEKFSNVQTIQNIVRSHKIPRKMHVIQKQQAAHLQAEMRKGHKGSALEVVRKGVDE